MKYMDEYQFSTCLGGKIPPEFMLHSDEVCNPRGAHADSPVCQGQGEEMAA